MNPAAPWAQQGWGHVGPEIVNATVQDLLGTEAAPAKPGEAVAFMEGMHQSRQEFWSRFP